MPITSAGMPIGSKIICLKPWGDYTKAIEINPGHVQGDINLKNAYSQLPQIRP